MNNLKWVEIVHILSDFDLNFFFLFFRPTPIATVFIVTHLNVYARSFYETQIPTSEPELVYYQHENHTLLSMTTTETPIQQQKPCKWTCELTNDRGYVVYSALGSFYIPMFVMLFFYWRIYRAAVRTTRAINQGFKTTKGKIYTNTLPLSIFLCTIILV